MAQDFTASMLLGTYHYLIHLLTGNRLTMQAFNFAIAYKPHYNKVHYYAGRYHQARGLR